MSYPTRTLKAYASRREHAAIKAAAAAHGLSMSEFILTAALRYSVELLEPEPPPADPSSRVSTRLL